MSFLLNTAEQLTMRRSNALANTINVTLEFMKSDEQLTYRGYRVA